MSATIGDVTENGHAPDGPLVSGHLVVYQLESGEGLLCFRPDGGDEDSIVRQPLMGMMTGPLVALLTGQPPSLDMGGANGKMLARVAKVMGLG